MEREILEGVFSPKEFWVVEKDEESESPLIFVFALAPRTGRADGSKVENMHNRFSLTLPFRP
jgi:hypothetical protein